jgi:hypothetical protein
MAWHGRAGLALVLLPLLGCSSCSGDRAVPFKRGVAAGEPTTDPGTGRAVPPAATGPGLPGAPTPPSHGYPAGTARIELGGRSLSLEHGAVRAALEVTLEGDDASSLLLVLEDVAGAASLARAHRAGPGWSPPEPVAALSGGGAGPAAACSLQSASLVGLGTSYALAETSLDCTATATSPAAPQPAAPATTTAPAAPPPREPPPAPAATHAQHHLWIATLEQPPRVLEHVATLDPEGPEQPRVTATVQSRDLDDDGLADVLLALDVAVGEPPTHVEIKLYNRAGGLARDTAEPERTLLELADRAKAERRSNAADAGALARRALALHGALCRESGTARLLLGTAHGLDCGASLGAGRAASVLAAVLATEGKLLDALARFQTLDQPSYRLTDNDRERARYALKSRVDEHGYAWRAGPALEPATGPQARRGAVAFIDEGHLLLRGAPGRSYDLGSGTLEPIGIPAQIAITDPSGRFALSTVVRSCDGYRLDVVLATQVVAGMVAGPSVSEPLIARAEPPPGAHCPELTREQRADTGGLRALEWTPQGVLLARGAELLLLPLDAAAAARGEARVLAPTDAVPGLSQSGELTADGRYHALITPLGLAIQDRKQGSTRLIAPPDGAGAITELALSPSGSILAVVQGAKVLIGTAREQKPATAGQPAQSAPSPKSATPPREPPPAPSTTSQPAK